MLIAQWGVHRVMRHRQDTIDDSVRAEMFADSQERPLSPQECEALNTSKEQ